MNVVFMFYVLFIFFISTNVNVGNKKIRLDYLKHNGDDCWLGGGLGNLCLGLQQTIELPLWTATTVNVSVLQNGTWITLWWWFKHFKWAPQWKVHFYFILFIISTLRDRMLTRKYSLLFWKFVFVYIFIAVPHDDHRAEPPSLRSSCAEHHVHEGLSRSVLPGQGPRLSALSPTSLL